MFKHKKNYSLQKEIIRAFILTSMIPVCIVIMISYVNTSQIVQDNATGLIHINLEQTSSSLDVWVDSYEDILFQVYMNDDIVHMVDELNQNQDVTLVAGQLGKTLRGMFYPKEYLKSILIITDSGKVVFYDLLTGAMTQSSWLNSIDISKEELYDAISSDNLTHFISTQKAGTYAANTYYLFHLGHRIIDYKNVNKELGVVIVSIDEEMLQNICTTGNINNNFNFIVDQRGRMVSFYDKEYLGKEVIQWSKLQTKRKESYQSFILIQIV